MGRWVGLGLGVCGVLAVGLGWMGLQDQRRWRDLDRLGEDWEWGWAAPVERVRAAVASMEWQLYRFQLTEDPDARSAFEDGARRVAGVLSVERVATQGTGVAASVAGLAEAWEVYLERSAVLLEKGQRTLRRGTAVEVGEQIKNGSADVWRRCQEWEEARRGWREGLRQEARGARLLGAGRGLWLLAAAGLLGMVGTAMGMWWHYSQGQQTARREAEAADQREALVSLGTFAAGVAHEIRNPISAIKVRLYELRRSQTEAAAIGAMEVIDGELRRLDRMLDEVLQYARPVEPRRESVGVDRMLGEVAELVRGAYARRGIEVVVEAERARAPGEGECVDADAEQLRQVLLNLVRNAAESMPSGGVVTLRAAAGVDAGGRSKPAMSVLLLEVVDTGPGIPPEVQARLFEPFFSTKPGGTGLGLAIAQRIVEAHAGALRYRTQPGQGTTFTVVLPRRMTRDETPTIAR